MKFVTFNIRCDFGQDGANNFIYRRPLILEKIRQEKPDIIGFQEVLPHQQQQKKDREQTEKLKKSFIYLSSGCSWLKENLTEYYIAGCGREKDLTGEAMIIAYRKERFQSVSLETFWLSPTPYVPGSRYPVQSMCPRTATDVVFEDMETGKVRLSPSGDPRDPAALEQHAAFPGVQHPSGSRVRRGEKAWPGADSRTSESRESICRCAGDS